MEVAPPATPRHTMSPLRLLPSGPDRDCTQACSQFAESCTAPGLIATSELLHPVISVLGRVRESRLKSEV